MDLTPEGIAVIEGDSHLSQWVKNEKRLTVHVHEWETLKPYVPEGGTVVDVGACLGSHSALASQWVGPRGTVHSFEPNPVVLDALRWNMRPYPNVKVYPFGLGAHEEHGLNMVQHKNIGMAHICHCTDGSVEVTTLDEVARDFQRLDLLKIDVEGYEPLVLDGAHECIRRWHPPMMLEVNSQALALYNCKSQDVFERLDDLGYSYTPLRAGDRLGERIEVDLLCLHRDYRFILGRKIKCND